MQTAMTTRTMPLVGSYAIDRASDLSKELGEALAQARIVVLDLSGAEELDLPAIQVIYAAGISAISRGGEIRFTGTASKELCARLVASGLSAQGPMTGEEFAARLPNFPKAPS